MFPYSYKETLKTCYKYCSDITLLTKLQNQFFFLLRQAWALCLPWALVSCPCKVWEVAGWALGLEWRWRMEICNSPAPIPPKSSRGPTLARSAFAFVHRVRSGWLVWHVSCINPLVCSLRNCCSCSKHSS